MLILLLNTACFIGDPSDTGNDGPTSWAGSETYVQGYGMSGEAPACTMVWSTSGAVSTRYACPECAFVFELDLTYDDTRSTQDGSCDALAVDTTAVYTYTEVTNLAYNYPGYDVTYGVIGTFDAGDWTELGSADWDPESGAFDYSYGTTDYSYGYKYGYYAEYTFGDAVVL